MPVVREASPSDIDQLVAWASERQAVEVHVDSYLANEAAQRLYEQLGFAVRSVARVLPLRSD